MDEYSSVKTVNCLYKDEEGRLWIGTNDSGVSIMIDETIINVVSEKEGLSADSVKCITQGSDGDYYIGTTGAMSVVSLAGGLTVKSYIDDIKYAVSADSDKNGNIAAVSDNGQLSIVKMQQLFQNIVHRMVEDIQRVHLMMRVCYMWEHQKEI